MPRSCWASLGARLVPVVGLGACALPALAICVLMGGVDPLALAGAFLITVCLGIFGVSARPNRARFGTVAEPGGRKIDRS
jgi:hypothetical protein